MINTTSLNKIIETIDKNNTFSSLDFEVKHSKDLLKIIYKYNSNFYFTITRKKDYNTIEKMIGGMTNKTKESFSIDIIEYSPAEIFDKYETEFRYLTDIVENINLWLSSLHEELSSDPKMRIVSSMNMKLEEVLSKLKDFPDEPFSDEEIGEWRERLDRMEINIKNELEKNSSEQKNLKNDIERLHNEIEILKSTLSKTPKPVWIKSVATKMFVWASKPDVRDALIENAKEIKNLIENNSL